jgi:hypothetical protein
MYGVMREYEVGSCEIDRLVALAGDTFVPVLRRQPGFVSYSMLEDGEVQGLITLSIFADRIGAELSVHLAASWVRDQVSRLLPAPPRHSFGQFTVHTIDALRPIGACVLRRYHLDPTSAPVFAARVGADLVPLLSRCDGFAGFFVLDSGSGHLVSFSAFTDAQAAAAAEATTLYWTRAHLSDLLPAAPEVISGPVKLHVARAAVA